MSCTTVSMSNCRRPQVGQAISTGPRSRSLSALRISQATLTSSSAWNVERETRIVSPMPSASSVPRPPGVLTGPDRALHDRAPALALLPGVERREGDADRVADAVGQQRPEADRGLERAGPLRARLGH